MSGSISKNSGNQGVDRMEGFILIGGASSRMGSAKALLKLGDQSFIELIASALSSIAQPIRSVSGRQPLSGSLPRLNNVADIHPHWGALGGLHTALAASQSPWAAVVACDLPFVTSDLFKRLATLRQDFDAVVPVQVDGRPQPLCALYRCQACLPKASTLIAAGERRPRALLDAVNTRWVLQTELDDLAGAANFFSNINTPDDYARALSLAGSGPAEN